MATRSELHKLGYSLRSNREAREGSNHPVVDRVEEALAAGEPAFGRPQEEGVGRRLQERRAPMAAERFAGRSPHA
jgi:hypothetical protein